MGGISVPGGQGNLSGRGVPGISGGGELSNTLWWTYKKLLKTAIEIVDFPIKNGDFPWQHVSSPEGITKLWSNYGGYQPNYDELSQYFLLRDNINQIMMDDFFEYQPT